MTCHCGLPLYSGTVDSNVMLPILNTKQYDQWKAFFAHGIIALQDQLSLIETNKPWSLTRVSTLSAVLLSVSKELGAFLSIASSLPPSSTSIGGRNIPQPEDSWLTAAITDLRVECHRYSLAAMQIAMAMERNRVRAKRRRAILASEDWRTPTTIRLGLIDDKGVVFQSSVTPSTSPTTSIWTSTSIQSWWSRTEETSPTGTMTPADSSSECGNK